MRADLSLAKLRGELVIPSQFTNSFLQRLLSKVLFCGNKNKPNSLNVRTSMMSGYTTMGLKRLLMERLLSR